MQTATRDAHNTRCLPNESDFNGALQATIRPWWGLVCTNGNWLRGAREEPERKPDRPERKPKGHQSALRKASALNAGETGRDDSGRIKVKGRTASRRRTIV